MSPKAKVVHKTNSRKAKSRPAKTLRLGNFRRIINSPRFPLIYALVSLAVLLASTLVWALLGANLQLGNADQLSNAYLFEHSSTFHGATLPGQHTFLIKWPLFLLLRAFGYSGFSFVLFTIISVLITVAVLAAILFRIERRFLVFGTICLALASALILVPAQPYPGGLLPVNMAMLTTRNLEYVLYIAGLATVIRSPRLKSRKFWLAVSLLALLVASDKLFAGLSLGAALLALIAYGIAQKWSMVSLSIRWLVGGLAGSMGAIILLWSLAATNVTHIAGQSTASPYGLVTSAHNVILGAVYSVLGLFTNFGANPAFDTRTFRNIPQQVLSRLSAVSGPTFVINAILLLFGLFVTYHLLAHSFKSSAKDKKQLDGPFNLSIMLIWTTLAAFGLFIFSDHYYAVDARYLTIAVFSVFISVATFTRQKKWQPEKIVLAGLIIVAGILLGLFTTVKTYSNDKSALADINQRNSLISQVLANHPVNVLVGDYWRVMPTKFVSGSALKVMPLSSCTQLRDTLSSSAWQPNLKTHSFAYLLSLDRSLTDYPNCSLQQIVDAYARPNRSVLIAGTLSQPKELLLIYDHGIGNSAPKTTVTQEPATVVPITIDQLPRTSCSVPTIMDVVAHQDDDLLFMNPDLQHDISAGHCVRTVYVTAGDGGGDRFYWLSREQGSEAAYSEMLGISDIWIERIVRLANNEYVSVANPRGSSQVSLIFMHLPDGNLKGQGFDSSHFETLTKLDGGQINLMHSVDSQSTYTADQLVAALTTLMHLYQPAEIRTQANYMSQQFPDHSDHMAVGLFVKKAYTKYETEQYNNEVVVPIEFYIGYPTHAMPANISDGDLQKKEKIFLDYAKFDNTVCQSREQCQHSPTYGAYLSRQYKNPY